MWAQAHQETGWTQGCSPQMTGPIRKMAGFCYQPGAMWGVCAPREMSRMVVHRLHCVPAGALDDDEPTACFFFFFFFCLLALFLYDFRFLI